VGVDLLREPAPSGHIPSPRPTNLLHSLLPMPELILASTSAIRATLMERARLPIRLVPPRVDEVAVKATLAADSTSPRDTADALAELKALKVSYRQPGALVIGCDQVLDLKGSIFDKPTDRDQALAQLQQLSGQTHRLHSAAVICEDARPVWRHVGVVRVTMRSLSPNFISDYLDRNWPDIGGSVGVYRLEEEGAQLVSRIDGSYFHVLGLPLLEIIDYLMLRGILRT
jgi:septum formation protein